MCYPLFDDSKLGTATAMKGAILLFTQQTLLFVWDLKLFEIGYTQNKNANTIFYPLSCSYRLDLHMQHVLLYGPKALLTGSPIEVV